jgi:hypothetical protein
MDEGARGGRGRRWWPPGLEAVWLAVPFVALLTRIGLKPAPPQDYWWPLVQGRALVEGGARLTTNTFVYTVDAAAPFFNQPWLAEWLMYRTHAAFGDVGLTWLHALLVVAAFGAGLGAALARGADPKVAAGVCAAAAVFGSLNMTIRTQMFAYPCFAVVCLAAMALSEGVWRWRWVMGAVVASAVWANVHGTFPLATLLMGAGAVGWAWERRAELDAASVGRWVAAVAAVAAAGCVHPSGLGNYAYVVELTGRVDGSTVTEWAAMPWDEVGGALFYAAALASAPLAWRWRARAGAALMMVGCGVLALKSQRSVIWWAWLVVPTLAPVWRARTTPAPAPEAPGRVEGAVNAALILGLLGGALAALPPGPAARALVNTSTGDGEPGDVAHPPPRLSLSREHAPELLDALARRGHPGRVFHAQALGGEVAWRLARPGAEQVAFVDQRFEMIPEEVWEAYFDIGSAAPGWEAHLERWGVGTVVISALEMPRLREELDAREGWREVARSWPYVVYMRAGAQGAWEEAR